MGHAGSSWGPQIPAATHRLGIPSHIYCNASPGVAGAWWFAGQLCYAEGVALRGGEDACGDESAFEAALPALLSELETLRRAGEACVLLFGGHPTRFRYTEFWDSLNFNRGQNSESRRYRTAARKDDEIYARGLRNLRRMLLAVRDLPGVEIAPVRALNGRFAPQNRPLAWAEVGALAESWADRANVEVADPLA